MPIHYGVSTWAQVKLSVFRGRDWADRLNPNIAQVFVDVTAGVQERLQKGFLCSTYNGHIHTAEVNGRFCVWRDLPNNYALLIMT